MYATLHAIPTRPMPAPLPEADPPAAPFAWRVLEEIDFGVIVLSATRVLHHANHLALRELSRSHFLRVEAGHLVGNSMQQTHEIAGAVLGAAGGRRQMLKLRNGADTLLVTCVPLQGTTPAQPAPVLLMLARQSPSANLNVGFFSRLHGLTPAEEAVLRDLCEGMQLKEIARAKNVSLSTVRTHVRALREKTGLRHIRLMVQRITTLPPLLPLNPLAPAAPPGTFAQ